MERVSYAVLKHLVKESNSDQTNTTLAIVGDCATQQLAVALRGEAVRRQLPLQVWDADFDQMEALLLDPASALYARKPEYIVLWACTERLQQRFWTTPMDARTHFAENLLERFKMLWQAVAEHSTAKLLMFDFPMLDDAVFGSVAMRVRSSFPFQLRLLNAMLGDSLADAYPHVFPISLCTVQSAMGEAAFRDARMWHLAKMAVQTEALPMIAEALLNFVCAASGTIKKCVIVDLDQTLWGGVIGDDGLDGIALGELGVGPAFIALQHWLKALQQRGILLAVCSKNEEATAKEPFLRHPDMVLRLDDFAMFVANWQDKASNIRLIQETLSIGMDSIVFLDDNPFERELVRGMLPEVTVPELPEDAAMVLPYLQSLHLFETTGLSEEDSIRTAQYQAEANRLAAKTTYATYEAYLQALDMHAKILPFDSFHCPRIAQLTQRSNQFNLRTVRYSEAEIREIAEHPSYLTRYMTLCDRFGDHGLIAVVILKKQTDALWIDTWLMSCRVLRRGVEQCLFDAIVALAIANGFDTLRAEYLPTQKNQMVASFYDQCGMTNLGNGQYTLSCKTHSAHRTEICVD